ncbi:MAG: hypothetical protein ACYTAF_11070, partial [Planctomycetota bacterium]
MKTADLLNRILWAFNGLLGAGIVVFAFTTLLFPERVDHLKGMAWVDVEALLKEKPHAPIDVGPLCNLRNPIVPDDSPAPSQPRPEGIRLVGI